MKMDHAVGRRQQNQLLDRLTEYGWSAGGRCPCGRATDSVDRLGSLFDIHYDRLYRLARRLSPSADDALDLVQDTFLKAARFAKSIPLGVTDEEAWLVRVLINIRRDQWRRKFVRDASTTLSS